MNALCYKTVFSKRLGALVAVGEHAASHSKGQGAGAASGAWTLGSVMRYTGVLALGFAWVSLAWSQTLPQGGQVSQGQVTISQSGQQMAITQSTAKAVVNWDSFDIGANAKVNIAQPSSQSVLLNRVLSDNPTQILGQLQANGQVVLVNPKGIVVGSDGSVSASAFTASTLNISDADFMAGNGRYTREGSTGEVVNKGRINVAPGGYVALLGAHVLHLASDAAVLGESRLDGEQRGAAGGHEQGGHHGKGSGEFLHGGLHRQGLEWTPWCRRAPRRAAALRRNASGVRQLRGLRRGAKRADPGAQARAAQSARMGTRGATAHISS
jgi:filamentous hemagglutinin family protein